MQNTWLRIRTEMGAGFFIVLAGSVAVGQSAPAQQSSLRAYGPTEKATLRAPGDTLAWDGPVEVRLPAKALGVRGTLALWFRIKKHLPAAAKDLCLFRSESLSASIVYSYGSTDIRISFGPEMTGSKPDGQKKPYLDRVLLTYLNEDQWYHAAWTWDIESERLQFFLDGAAQENLHKLEYPGQIRAVHQPVKLVLGGPGVSTSALFFSAKPLTESELGSLYNASGQKGYTDEGLRRHGQAFRPLDVDWSHPVYATRFESPAVLEEWRLEGGRAMTIADGHLVLQSTAEPNREQDTNHLVCWLAREIPGDFLLQFGVRPQDRRQGLNIVFFNARGLNGESILDSSLPPRDGTFRQYHSGDLNCYHISYWSGGRGTANLRKNHGFHLAAIGPDLVENGPADRFQTVQIYKRGGMIRLTVDGRLALSYDDDGRRLGPVITNSGWIGLRQMASTRRCEYDHLAVYPLLNSSP